MDEYAREISPTLLLPKTVIPPSKVPSVRTTPAPETNPQTKTTTASKLNSVVKKLWVRSVNSNNIKFRFHILYVNLKFEMQNLKKSEFHFTKYFTER